MDPIEEGMFPVNELPLKSNPTRFCMFPISVGMVPSSPQFAAWENGIILRREQGRQSEKHPTGATSDLHICSTTTEAKPLASSGRKLPFKLQSWSESSTSDDKPANSTGIVPLIPKFLPERKYKIMD